MTGRVKKIDKKITSKRKNYSPSKLQKALSLIESGEASARNVSNQFNIPRTTLMYKINGKRLRNRNRPGPEPMLGINVEETLENWVQTISKQGFPLTREGLCYSAHKLLQEGHGKTVHTFNENKGPGRKWFESFMNRHPTLAVRKAEYLHNGRAATNEANIRKWFKEISLELKDYMSIFEDTTRIYNCDETSFFLHPKSRPVIAKRGQRNVYDASGKCDKENMTVLVTGNAAGEIVPPMAVVSFKKIPTDIATLANPAWPIGRTQNGWMTCASFFEYIANIFNSYLEKNKIAKPVILFFDGHSSHISLQLSEFCKENDIVLVSLPPNATHILQPLDVTVFGPLKKDWQKKLEIFKFEKQIEPRKCHVLPILESIFNQENFVKNLAKGFQSCGLCPLNPDAVDYSRCLDDEKNNSDKSKKDPSDNRIDCDLLLTQFQQKLPGSLMNVFEKINQNGQWTGNEKLSGLFSFYQSIKFDLNFEDIFQNELDLDVSVTYANLDDEILPSVHNDVDHFNDENEFHQSALITDDISALPIENTSELADPNENISELANNIVFDTNDSDNALHQNDNLNNDVPELTISIPSVSVSTSQITPTQVETPLSSSSSGKSSVHEILNSIVRYQEKETSPGKKKKIRKKLHLPAVMTSQSWLDLKKAKEQEKDDFENKKKERKERIELAKKARLEEVGKKKQKRIKAKENRSKLAKAKPVKENPANSKLAKSKSSKLKQKSNTLFKNSISKMIENPKEVEIGHWLVAEFKEENAAGVRFIGKLLKVSKGILRGTFLRSKITRDFNGYIYNYPDVEDIYDFSFDQILKLLPDPETYGRGMLKFCIHAKNL